ncbi:hypothetical protein [Streptomyces sp. NPDC093097]|uniref:hypothetical protein n=1 Tax=Streptomyces sp. NPDC093097 TaxID=3366027 RepID=UPI0037FC1EE3
MTGELTLELNCRTDRTEGFARSAAAWLTEARAELFPAYEAGLADEPAAQGPDENDPDASWGRPHGVCAQLLVQRAPHGPGLRPSRYSRRTWKRLLSTLPTPSAPYRCLLLMHLLDARGHPVDHEHAVSVEFRRSPEHPGWTRFAASAPAALLPWPGSEEVQQRWLGLLGDWAVRLNAGYGHLTDDADPAFGTALERMLNLSPEDTVPHSDRTLRGYAWGTLCSAEVAARVGGPEALRASGAFHAVTELPGGRLLLKATPRLEHYTGDAPARVLRALAPALPPGRTDRAYLHSWMRLAPDGDAADWQR